MDIEGKITDLAYVARGLAYVMLYATDEVSTNPKNDDDATYLYTQVLVLCEKLDELCELIDHPEMT